VCIELSGTQCGEPNLAEDADDDFFSKHDCIINIILSTDSDAPSPAT